MNGTSTAEPLLVGAAAVDVTPSGPVELSGFGARTEPSGGVHDPVYARALAIAALGCAPVVLITLDVVGVDATLADAVRGGLVGTGVVPGDVAVIATHTHAAPATLGSAFLGEVDTVVTARIAEGAVTAARAALAALAPAELRFGRARAPGVARNRRIVGGPVDDELSVLSFWRPGATAPAALLVTFALHPVVLGANNLLISRDYVGYLVDAVEAEHPGCTALFACGCAGQVNTGHPASASWTTAAAEERTFAAAEAVGRALSDVAREIVAGRSSPVAGAGVSMTAVEVDLDFTRSVTDLRQELNRLMSESRAAKQRGDSAVVGLLSGQLGWVRWRLAYGGGTDAPAENLRVRIQGIRLGEMVLVLLPGEPFVEYALALKERHGASIVPIGYANEAPGYLPTASAFAEGGYEVDLAYRYYGQPGAFEPSIEATILTACDELIGRLRPDTLV